MLIFCSLKNLEFVVNQFVVILLMQQRQFLEPKKSFLNLKMLLECLLKEKNINASKKVKNILYKF